MTRWIRPVDRDEWTELFASYLKSAFRLEGQQIYSSDSEDAHLAKFLAGDTAELDLSPRFRTAIPQIAAGRAKTTVRVVIEPPTDYTRMAFSLYPRMIAIGEEIRIIAVPEGEWPADLPQHDYWLFDDRDVWRLHYDDGHRAIGAELLDGEDVLTEHLRWRDIALAQSIPFDDYLSSRAPTE